MWLDLLLLLPLPPLLPPLPPLQLLLMVLPCTRCRGGAGWAWMHPKPGGPEGARTWG